MGANARVAVVGVAAVLLAGCASPAPVLPNGALVPVGERVELAEVVGESLLEPGVAVSTRSPVAEVTVVNVWGAWCGPCRGEVVELERVREATAGDGVRLVGVNVRDHVREYAVDFARDVGMGYPSIYDPAARVLLGFGKYRNVGVPTTLVLDREHRVAAAFVGAVLAEDVLPRIEQVLDAAEPPHRGGAAPGN